MPFKSSKQRAYLYANKPELAKEWTSKYGGKIGGSKKQRRRAVELARLRRKRKKKK